MVLSRAYDVLKESGSQVTTFIQGQPLIKQYVERVQNHPWITLGVTTGAVIMYKYITRRRDLPPGPFNWPLLGAVSCFTKDFGAKMLELRPAYGDIIYLKLMGNEVVILNSEKSIWEAFLHCGDEFSETQLVEIIRDGIGPKYEEIIHPHFHNNWKENRKFALTALRKSGFGTARSESKIQSNLDKLETLLVDQEAKAISPKLNFEQVFAALTLSVYFDENLELDDPKLLKFISITENWMKALDEGLIFYDFLLRGCPLLRHLLCRKTLTEFKKAQNALDNEMQQMVQAHQASLDPTNPRDLVDHYLLHHPEDGDVVVCFLIELTLSDAINTTSVFVCWLVFYLAKFQHVQKKLKQQLVDVVGQGRNPTLSDRSELPFADAIILETLRCINIVPIGIPRKVTHDLEFGGYKIPKTATVQACLYSVHYDPDTFPEPQKFDPSRFIDNDGKLIQTMAGHVMPFGLGPRQCMGEQYTKSVLFLTVSRLIHKFSITFDSSQPEPSLKPDLSGPFKMPAPHKICFIPQ